MNFSELIKKGKKMISDGSESLKQSIEDKKESMKEYDLLITKSDHLKNMMTYEELNKYPHAYRDNIIMSYANITIDNARIINRLIPIDETIIDIKVVTESKSSISYYVVLTDLKIWILNSKEYTIRSYNDVNECKIISKGLVSQYTSINGNAFLVDGTVQNIEDFFSLLLNINYRNETIKTKIQYLCGIIPSEQYINKYSVGVTMDDSNHLILHNYNKTNTLININEIVRVELYLDDNSAIIKGILGTDEKMIAPIDAKTISLKIITSTNQYSTIILPQNILNTNYSRDDSSYILQYNFAKSIILRIASIITTTK